jgi:chorismate synthase
MGGSFEVIAHGVPPGLGSHVQWDRKLDGRLAQALMSIPAIKAVGIGRGPEVASLPGHASTTRSCRPRTPSTADRRRAADQQRRRPRRRHHQRQDLRIMGYMKPIATLMKPLRSVDLTTMEMSPAAIEASDVCAVPAAAVVAEAMVAIVLADALVEKFGGDSIDELLDNVRAFRSRTSARFSHIR